MEDNQKTQSMWKYSIGAFLAALVLQIVTLLFLKTFSIGASLVQALIVAYGVRAWYTRSAKRLMTSIERKRLLLQYAILVGLLFLLLGSILAHRHRVALILVILNLLINWLPFPFFLFRATRDKQVKQGLPDTPETSSTSDRRRPMPPDLKNVTYIIAAQMAFSILVALFTPSNILSRAWAQNWVNTTLGTFAPNLLKVPAASSAPQVAVFYNATMFVTALVFTLMSVVVIIMTPIPPIIKNEVEESLREVKIKTGTTMSKSRLIFTNVIIVVGIAFSWGHWLLSPKSLQYDSTPIGVMLWASRTNLVIGGTLFWAGPTLLVSLLVLGPNLFKKYWNSVPWFQKR